MNVRNFLYTSLLSATILVGCKSTLPSLQNPETRAELVGIYKGKVNGLHVQYTVEKNRCRLFYEEEEPFPDGYIMKTIIIDDDGCDNKADSAPDQYGFMRNRTYLIAQGTVNRLDCLLEKAQHLVKLENKAE